MAGRSELKRFGKFIEGEDVVFHPPSSSESLIGYVISPNSKYMIPGYLHIGVPSKSMIYIVPECYVRKLYDFEILGDKICSHTK